MLYTALRIIEGLITIALQVRPLGSLRVISMHCLIVLKLVEMYGILLKLV
jgi:hypothetical protein